MMNARMVTKNFITSLNKMVEERQIAVTKAINVSAVSYRNAIVMGMRQTIRRASAVAVEAASTKKKKRAKKKMRRVHIPSAPGNPPAPDTGLLVNSVRIDFAKNQGGKFEAVATIGTPISYAPILEYDLNRPVWHPVWNAQLPAIRQRIVDAQNGKK